MNPMSRERWRRVELLCAAARKLPPGGRAPYLAQACEGDEELRSAVEALLAGDTSSTTAISLASSSGPGSKLGPYQLEWLLGEGGMGQVFRARDTRLGRSVAIKVIRSESAVRADFQLRFRREAQAVAALNHPHICTLYDVGEQDGFCYLVMEFVEGQTLAYRLREGPLPADQLLRRAVETAQALAAAHERGIIHRDLKPANLMLTSNGIKVLDFGLAKFTGPQVPAGGEATEAFTILGTPAYMSPEQALGEELDLRSDIFSLGCVLYEAATGVRPFRGDSVSEILREVVSGHPPPPSSLRPELRAGWDAVLQRAMAKERNRRYASAADFVAALDQLQEKAAKPAPRTEERQADPVFGRGSELQRLAELLQSAVSGNGKVVMVSGEPGIGKTALTRNFVYGVRKRNEDLVVILGSCVEQYGTGEAYLPFLDAIGNLLQNSNAAHSLFRLHAPTWCLQFPAVFSGATMEQIQREATGATKDRMLRELGDALSALTAETPVLLVLEDFHWADPASVDMMRHLAERSHDKRLMVVVTARPEDIERNNPALKKCYTEMRARAICQEIALRAISLEDVTAYLDSHFAPNEFPAELARVIHRKSEGHPLFVTGAIQILTERGDIARTNGAWRLNLPLGQMDVDVPASVRSMIEKKVGLLSEEQRQTLLYASIEGEEFTSTVLSALLEIDELDLEERLDKIAKVHRLIYVDTERELPDGAIATVYRFSHALYQYFLYDQLLSKRRILLHRRAAETLERTYSGQLGRVASQLATHFEKGRDFPKAIEYLLQAGATALSRYAYAEAAAHFTHGLELVDKLPEDQRAARKAALLQKRAGARTALGLLNEAGADYLAMSDACRAAGDEEGECRALIGVCLVAQNARDVESMERYNPEARALAEKIGNEDLVAEATNAWAMYNMACGSLAEAETSFARSIPTARKLNDRPALVVGLTFKGVLRFWKSDYAEAEQLQMESTRLCAEERDGFHWPLALLYLGWARANQGNIAGAMTAMQEGLDLARRNNNALALSRIPNGIGWVWRETGNLGKAIEFNEGNVEITQRTGAAEGEANALINLVYDYLEAGHPHKAADALERIYPLYEREKWNRWRFYGIRHPAASAEYLLGQRRLDGAEEYARLTLTNAERNDVPKYTAIARRLLGQIAAARGDGNAAEEELLRSLEPFSGHPMPLIEWRNHLALARLLKSRNRPAAARESYRQAERLLGELAANISDPAQRAGFLIMDAVREVLAGAAGG
jgi:serine/threonine protein kinase/tetratricopeptide (TPR) repeat protein